MKRTLQLLILIFSCSFVQAQVDTVLFENFQIDPFADMDSEATGDNTNWVDFDEDGLATAFGTEESMKWFWGEFFTNPVDPMTGETNYIATSLSFLEGAVPGNRNWLILPPIEVTDDSYMISWQSAPNQMPRYMDGYIVVAAIGNNEPTSSNFTDTLFQAASMETITGDGQSIDYSNFDFTDGYLHAEGGTITEYFEDNGGTLLRGLLEPHSVSLAAYEGQTVYLAFLHNSDDDERIGLDDILVTKAMSSNTNNEAIQKLRMECFPNPVVHQMNLNYYLKNKSEVTFEIINSVGQLVKRQEVGSQNTGTQSLKMNLNWLPAGNYFIRLEAGDVLATQSFLKY